MAELNIQQIVDKLNSEFSGDSRKLVFWYDDKAEFIEDMETVELENASIYWLKPDNQFYTKCFLERKDKENSYLIYAPFPKPEVKDNHLEDILLYSKRFFADRASLLSVDLGIEERYKPIIERHIKFFSNKERTNRFYELEIENFNEENILTGLLSAICKTKTCSFDEVLRIVISEGFDHENKYTEEMDKYGLLDEFWKLCEQQYGYIDENPTLERLIVTLFVTYTGRYLQADVPKPWRSFVSMKQGNVIAFLDSLMNSILYRDDYDSLSNHVLNGLKAKEQLGKLAPDDYIQCDTFSCFDEMILAWIKDRLIAEDIGTRIDDLDIVQLCDRRLKMHFGGKYENEYYMLENAFSIIKAASYDASTDMKSVVKRYCDEDYRIDTAYRKFYFYFDKLSDTGIYEELQTLVENIYTNEYLSKIIPRWNEGVVGEDGQSVLPLQRNFFSHSVNQVKERVVVIISDAMRYEVGKELFDRLQDDPRCSVKLDAMMSVLPSYTRLGMAALLPHHKLEMHDDYEVYADDVLCNDLAGRQTVLQGHCKDSVSVQYKFLVNMKKTELREVFTGKQVIYVYHNQIDKTGDEQVTENQVFDACDRAIDDLIGIIRKISINANTYRFIVTADHGFIYKRNHLDESDKISGIKDKDAWKNHRFVVSKNQISEDGVGNIGLGYILGNDDDKVVSYPIGSNIFKCSGGGMNFVHGGSSPQEMIVPVLDLKMERGHMETKSAQIMLVSLVQKITNLITGLDFIQSDPVGDTVKETTYRLVFKSEDDENISNENIYVADSRESDSAKRIFRLKFNFKNQKYDKDKQYYLVVTDDTSGLELFRHPVIMDLMFGDDFGF